MDQEQFQGIMLEQMARITQEITELRLGQDDLRKVQDDLRKGQDDLYRGQEKIAQRIVVIEKDMHDKFGVLFDFVDKQNHVNTEILYDLKGLHNKIDRLELETAHVRRVK